MKALIAYFSCSGVTARVAHELAKAAGADTYEIKPAQPYTAADLNWMDKSSRSTLEMKDENCRPAIADSVDLAQYDVVFVGFPIWWGIAPRIIETFLENYDFAGKTVVPFCTSGGSGVGKTDAVLHKLCPPTVHWKPCKKLSAAASQRELGAWLQSLQL
ncbi:MAG TPA: flavodoxin [Candidatus Gallimonas intestinigallinarum]|uniref:Flavodoxin n=1 Tax=Candidatus Gallimonas intestinigallinarum TaxID=2838604 RepID=A0A9D2DXL5_9FIRM|nr:flavodoxin [Candidatus Gallimonas intestinigallinarum]